MSEISDRYSFPRIIPTEDVLQIQFAVLATINSVVMIASLVLILGICRTKSVRTNVFNTYIMFMSLPDFIASSMCLLTCAMGAYMSRYYSQAMCEFQSFYLTFSFTANAWTNAVIVSEVYKLLKYSKGRRRYFPPTRQRVFCRIAAIYAFALALGALVSFNIPGVPARPEPYNGLACMPMEYDRASTYFYYIFYFPAMLVVPLAYVMCVAVIIFWKGMLPKSGRTRFISSFLLRLIAIYFVGWGPYVTLKIAGNWVKINPWVPWVGSAFAHFQGFFTSVCAFFTCEIIGGEMKKVMHCNFWDDSEDPIKVSKRQNKKRTVGSYIGASQRTTYVRESGKSINASENGAREREDEDTVDEIGASQREGEDAIDEIGASQREGEDEVCDIESRQTDGC